jgi:hypothetical protein
MSDQSHLLADPATADAIAAHVGAPPGHKIVGLHDEVLVRPAVVTTTSPFDTSGAYIGPARIVEHVEAATVEVILSTPTGRVYAWRYRGTLADFLIAAEVVKEVKAS